MIVYLDEQQVAGILTMHDLISAMRQAVIDFSSGKVQQPVRTMLSQHNGFLGLMPASGECLGAKLVTFYPKNADLNIHTHNAIIVLFMPQTGEPLAIMDGRLITEMRTAAVSAVATDLLAPRAATSLALLGSGIQARSHVEALRLVRNLTDIRVWSRTPANAEKLAAEIGGRALPIEQAVAGADIVVTVTSAMSPILKGEWLKPGCHVNAVGACRPDWRELDDATMANVVVVDSRDGALTESGDVILSNATIYGELGEIASASLAAPVDKTTIFKSLGMAIEDVAAAQLVYQRYLAAREG
jgi:ornithine cyclodeaminase/alanine dehydrogenase-like protein (mu-crystallin family)